MNFEELQNLWREDTPPPQRPHLDAAILESMTQAAHRFEKSLYWRDLREVAAAILLGAVFLCTAYSAAREGAPSWPLWIAAIPPFAVAAVFGWLRTRSAGSTTKSVTVVETLRTALVSLCFQERLLARVAWWYALPLSVSGGLITLQVAWYAPLPLPVRIFALLIMGVIIVGVHWGVVALNRRALEREVRPKIVKLRTILASFES